MEKYFFKKRGIQFILFLFLIISMFQYGALVTQATNLGDAWTKAKEAAGPAGYVTEGLNQIETLIATIIQTALTFLGVVFLILAIYGGYLWMTARGNEEQLTRAKNTLTAAVVGLIIVIGAYAISYFVIERLGKGTLE